jgi:hypothetical protein
MDSKAILKLDVEFILQKVEEILQIKLPPKILEISLLPEDSLLYIRFNEASGREIGEPAHPLIHVFNDEKGNLTSLEIIDINRFIKEPSSKLIQMNK